MIFLGIDPGLDGGLAFLDDETAEAGLVVMPTLQANEGSTRRTIDRVALRKLLTETPITRVAIEHVTAAPAQGRVQGTSSMFNFGLGFGLVLGMLSGLQLSYAEVAPQTWKKKILAGTAKDKLAAIEYCQRQFPAVSLLATPRSKKPHDGLADALCLAEYARRLYRGES